MSNIPLELLVGAVASIIGSVVLTAIGYRIVKLQKHIVNRFKNHTNFNLPIKRPNWLALLLVILIGFLTYQTVETSFKLFAATNKTQPDTPLMLLPTIFAAAFNLSTIILISVYWIHVHLNKKGKARFFTLICVLGVMLAILDIEIVFIRWEHMALVSLPVTQIAMPPSVNEFDANVRHDALILHQLLDSTTLFAAILILVFLEFVFRSRTILSRRIIAYISAIIPLAVNQGTLRQMPEHLILWGNRWVFSGDTVFPTWDLAAGLFFFCLIYAALTALRDATKQQRNGQTSKFFASLTVSALMFLIIIVLLVEILDMKVNPSTPTGWFPGIELAFLLVSLVLPFAIWNCQHQFQSSAKHLSQEVPTSQVFLLPSTTQVK